MFSRCRPGGAGRLGWLALASGVVLRSVLSRSPLGCGRLDHGQHERERRYAGCNVDHARGAGALHDLDRRSWRDRARNGRRQREIAHALGEPALGNYVCRNRRRGSRAHAPANSMQQAQAEDDSDDREQSERHDGADGDGRAADEHAPAAKPVEQGSREHAHERSRDGHERRREADNLARRPQLRHVHRQPDVQHLETEEHG